MRHFLILVLIGIVLTSPLPATTENAKTDSVQGKAVLVVMDIQNAYFPYMDEKDIDPAMRMINATIELFRAQGLPVIRVYHTDLDYGPPVESEAFQFPETVRITKDDAMVIKNYPSAFKKTELQKTLRELGADTVFLTGLSATGCVLATYYDAVNLDFNTFMVKGALISNRADLTDAVEEITGAVGYNAVQYMIANSSH